MFLAFLGLAMLISLKHSQGASVDHPSLRSAHTGDSNGDSKRPATYYRRVHRMSFLVSGNHLFSGNLAKGKACLRSYWIGHLAYASIDATGSLQYSDYVLISKSERELLCMQFKIFSLSSVESSHREINL